MFCAEAPTTSAVAPTATSASFVMPFMCVSWAGSSRPLQFTQSVATARSKNHLPVNCDFLLRQLCRREVVERLPVVVEHERGLYGALMRKPVRQPDDGPRPRLVG